MREELCAIFGGVEEDVAAHAGDSTENEPKAPAYVVVATREEQIPALLKLAHARKVPVTPKVTGLNVGGLAIPAEGGIVLDLKALDAIEIDAMHMVAWIGPGTTWQQLKDAAAVHDLALGFPLAPPESSVLACALMDGLNTMSLLRGSFGDWVQGVVAYLADGTRVVTGSAAVSGLPLSRGPLPDLTGLFMNWFGTTGIVTRLALALWPLRAHRRRDVIACRTLREAFDLMRLGSRTGLFEDLAALGWPAAKWALGLERLGPRDPAEPLLYLIAQYAAESEEEVALQARRLRELAPVPPIPVDDLVTLAPELQPFAELPARLGFLLDYPGGGLTWVGTYGPLDRLEEGAAKGMALMEAAGHPPLVVSRPMRGGHVAVLRFIERFDRASPEETANVRALNVELGRMLMDLGYVPYKCPGILYDELFARLDPGFRDLMERVRKAVDPHGILNPDRGRAP